MTTASTSFATNRSTPSLPPLIGLIGKPYVGKDTVAHYLIDRYRFVQCAFGDHIKLVAMQHYDLSLAQVTTSLKDRIDPRWNKTPREILQYVGRTSRHIAPRIWIDKLMNTIVTPMRASGQSIVISDVRDPMEADAIKAAEGILWRILRPEATILAQRYGMPPASQQDSLEQGLEGYPADQTLTNIGTLADLYRQVDTFISPLAPQHVP
jgi:hypothetical protein